MLRLYLLALYSRLASNPYKKLTSYYNSNTNLLKGTVYYGIYVGIGAYIRAGASNIILVYTNYSILELKLI